MPTIGEVYGPMVAAGVAGDPKGHELLEEAAAAVLRENPDRCASLDDARDAVRKNLDYYCQYFDGCDKVKRFYKLGDGFQTLGGEKLPVP